MSASALSCEMCTFTSNVLPKDEEACLTVHCIEVSDTSARRLQALLRSTQQPGASLGSVGRAFHLARDATVDAVKEELLALCDNTKEERDASASTLEANKTYNRSILQVFAVRRPLMERMSVAAMDADERSQGEDANQLVTLPDSLPVASLLDNGQFTSCNGAKGPELVLLYCYGKQTMGMDCQTLCGVCICCTCLVACIAACCCCCSSKGKGVQSSNPYPQKPNQNPMQPGYNQAQPNYYNYQ